MIDIPDDGKISEMLEVLEVARAQLEIMAEADELSRDPAKSANVLPFKPKRRWGRYRTGNGAGAWGESRK